jgi:hypothetical protein
MLSGCAIGVAGFDCRCFEKLLTRAKMPFFLKITYSAKPPTFRLVVESKGAGVVNPDVNMLNNRKEAQAQ